ncbi:hypothetical protein [Micromonospora carbonacea]|uniref:Uncharacterized protein n=1 Tax=Micromonospora carbonacea TaxID=47853 RepID=A0A1C5ACI7_9ACTN|nr:hypothetical protein [Micromonospora carbonacea]SCF42962.1 hypothetical protein GA0070563_112164 [Micromonospora carbonacea]
MTIRPATQPALFDAASTSVPHPGSACCDPNQDLAGWIQLQRARIERDRRWIRVLHQRGRRLRKAATRALTNSDTNTSRALDGASVDAHGLANALAQDMLIREGEVERIEAAHQYRLQATNTYMGDVA